MATSNQIYQGQGQGLLGHAVFNTNMDFVTSGTCVKCSLAGVKFSRKFTRNTTNLIEFAKFSLEFLQNS